MGNTKKQDFWQTSSTTDQYNRWRITFLATIMRVVAGLGFLLLVTNISNLNLIESIVFSIIYVSLLIATFANLPFTAKASALIGSGYIVGIYVLLKLGPWSSASAYLLGTTLLASLLFDEGVDRWVLVLCSLSIVLAGIMNSTGFLTLAEAEISQTESLDWLAYLADYIVLALSLVWAINLLKAEFISVIDRLQSAIGSLSKDRSELEQRVEERTAGLLKKTYQLQAASYIARQTAQIQDLDTILRVVTNLITDQFGFYHAGIFLVTETGEKAVLVSASSEGGQRMIEKGYSLKIASQDIVGYAAAQKKPRIALDSGADSYVFKNPDLPMTRSEIAVPMSIQDRVLGVLDIQSEQPVAFSSDDIEVLHTLADQLAIAIENTRLFDESRTALTQIEALTASSTRESWSRKLAESNISYTYTPLGTRAGNTAEDNINNLKVPITLRGQNIGSILLSRKNNIPWSDIDREMTNEIAYQTGLAVDNARLVEEAIERAKQEKKIGELVKRFSQTMDVDSLLQVAARELGQVPEVAEVSVFIGKIPEQPLQRRQTK